MPRVSSSASVFSQGSGTESTPDFQTDVEQGQVECMEEGEQFVNDLDPNTSSMSLGTLWKRRDLFKRALLCEVEPVNFKPLSEEIRGHKDLSRFANDPDSVVLLDVKQSTSQGIVERILKEMIARDMLCEEALDEAKNAILGSEPALGLSRPQPAKNMQSEEHRFEYHGAENTEMHWHKNIQGPSFIVPFGRISALDSVEKRLVGVARLAIPSNLGAVNDSLTHFVVIVLGPTKEIKGVKTPFELGRTFASLLQDDEFFSDAKEAKTSADFKQSIICYLDRLTERQAVEEPNAKSHHDQTLYRTGRFAGGLLEDIRRRYKWDVYSSDWTDGITDRRSIFKYISAVVWLYFAIIMPTIAFGAVNDRNTALSGSSGGEIGVTETILSQALCGLVFAVLAGQPLVIVMTTGPLTVFIEVLFSWSSALGIPFLPFYAWTGLWTALILIVLVLTDASAFMKYCGSFTEEIFATLIAAIFVGEFIKPLIHVAEDSPTDVFLLAFLLASGTYLVAHWLLEFRRSFLLKPAIRTLLSDFGVPISIILMSALRRAFASVEADMLKVPDRVGLVTSSGRSWIVPLFSIEIQYIFLAAVSGFLLAVLFFLDQNISSILVNRPENKLKKGPGYHLDLAVVAVLLAVTSIFGLTWTHAALPHSPLHARALADVDEYEEHGRRYERVVKARETRITGFVTHILIALSILIKDALGNIPMAVLYGFFLYMGIATLYGNLLWDRILLWFTQKEKYPPNHYVRRVPVKKIHLYTCIQVSLLVLLWFVKSNFYLGDTTFNTGLLFPFIIGLFLPIRMFVLTRFFTEDELTALASSET